MSPDKWEQFAQKDAEFYIYSVDVDYATAEGKKFFFESGRKDMEKILSDLGDDLTSFSSALEIGCGVGRLLLSAAGRFDRVVGVDVSPTMLEKLRSNLDQAGVVHYAAYLSSDRWDDERPSLIYSYLVFQHIQSWDVIDDYFKRIAGCVGDGVCYAQFDTRPRSLSYRIKGLVPDPLLPRTMRRGIRRIRRDRDQLIEMFKSYGLEVVAEHRPNTEDNAFILRRH